MKKVLTAILALPSNVDRTPAMAGVGDVGHDAADDTEEANVDRRLPGQQRPSFRFLVSQDEEHVRLELSLKGVAVNLGERAHHQTLLLLARERRADDCQGVIPSEAGWRDVVLLGAMLGIDSQHINTHLFRALRQISPLSSQFAIAFDLVERRRGQVRFGDAACEVVNWKGLPATRR